MTLYELISKAPWAKTARACAAQDAERRETEQQRKRRTRRWLRFLTVLLATRPAPGCPYALVEVPYCDDGSWQQEASLIRGADLSVLMADFQDRPLYTRRELSAMTMDRLETAELELRDILPPAVDYAFLPWPQVLGAKVLLPRGVPVLPFLASVLATMSYAGFTPAQQAESRRRLLALMEARGEVKRLSAPEAAARAARIRALFPAPPEEEQENLSRAMAVDTVLSLQGEYEMYQALQRGISQQELQ